MCKVLLVDDEEAIRQVLGELLERRGFTVITAPSAARAQATLQEGAFDIVITDLRMESPLAGFQVVRAASRVCPRPLIIVLTAFPVPTPDWRNAGADALYLKDANIFHLPEQLKAGLSAFRARVHAEI